MDVAEKINPSTRVASRHALRQRLFKTEATDTLPLAINHDRIYILPRRRGWAFLGALLIILVASINYSLSLGYALCFLLSGLFGSTLFATFRNMSGVTIKSIADADSVASEPLLFDMVLTGKTPNSEHHDIEISGEQCYARADVTADTETRLVLPRQTTERDVLSLGRLTVESDYPLGLWRAWAYVHTPVTGYVSPKPEINAPEPPGTASDANQQTEGIIDSTRVDVAGEFAGLRPYRPGDTPSAIAWKQLARGNALQAREFHQDITPDRLSLDWEQTQSLVDTEKRLSRLAAWLQMAQRTARPYTLHLGAFATNDNRVGTGANNHPAERSDQITDHQQALRLLAGFGNPRGNRRGNRRHTRNGQ